jgi:hypothetical protein
MTGAGAVAISGDTVVLARDGIAHSERVVVLPYWDRLHTYDWMLGPMLHERVRFVILAGVNLGALACLAALALWWRERRALMLASALTLLSACGPTAKPPPSEPMQTKPAQADEPLVGHVARSEVEKLPKWIDAKKQDDPDPAAAKALASVPAGAKVRVFFGTWCGDSRREVTRFWKALDLAGKVPFEVEYVAVDHAKHAPGDLEAGAGLRYVPTFIVVRDGKEIGRIIESSPNGIEVDLGKLLRGERGGVISLRTDVGAT